MKYTLTARELSNFFGQLGMLIHSGISVTEGLAILQDESQTDTDREIITATAHFHGRNRKSYTGNGNFRKISPFFRFLYKDR